MNEVRNPGPETSIGGVQVSLQSVYLKDCSYESPNGPRLPNNQAWEPKFQLNMNTSAEELAADVREVARPDRRLRAAEDRGGDPRAGEWRGSRNEPDLKVEEVARERVELERQREVAVEAVLLEGQLGLGGVQRHLRAAARLACLSRGPE